VVLPGVDTGQIHALTHVDNKGWGPTNGVVQAHYGSYFQWKLLRSALAAVERLCPDHMRAELAALAQRNGWEYPYVRTLLGAADNTWDEYHSHLVSELPYAGAFGTDELYEDPEVNKWPPILFAAGVAARSWRHFARAQAASAATVRSLPCPALP